MSLYKYFPSKDALVIAFLRKRDGENPVHQVSAEFYDKFRNYIADLARQCGSKSPESLALQLSLLIEGAIVSKQMKRHSGAVEQA